MCKATVVKGGLSLVRPLRPLKGGLNFMRYLHYVSSPDSIARKHRPLQNALKKTHHFMRMRRDLDRTYPYASQVWELEARP